MLKVRDIMTRDVFTLAPQSTIREAMELLTANHLSGAPVLAGENLVGVVSMGDILGLLSAAPEPSIAEERIFVVQGIDNLGDQLDDDEVAELFDANEDAWDEWATAEDSADDISKPSGVLDSRTVEEIMSSEIFSITPGASVKEAASRMASHGIHRLIVTEHKSLVGILSALDIARAVSQRGIARKHAK